MALAARAFPCSMERLTVVPRVHQLLSELLAFHARFPALFDANAEPKLLLDLEGDLVAANAAAAKLLERPATVIRGNRFVRAFSRYMGSYEQEAFTLAAAGRTARVATTIARPDGRLVAIEASLFPAIVDGQTVGVYVSALDVTSRMERERSTARRIQELSSLFQHHAHSTISVDAVGRIRSLNPAAERLLGYAADEIIGQPYASFVFEDAAASTTGIVERAMSGHTTTGISSIRHKSGARIDVAGVVIPIFVDDRIVGAYAVGDDRERLHGATERIRELYLLAADPSRGAEAQLATALEIGRERLDCREAYVARVDADDLVYVHCTGRGSRREGERTRRAGSLDDVALASAEPVSAADATGAPSIAAAVVVGGQAYGTIAFVGPGGRSFAPDDVDYVRLISSLASAAIDRALQHRRLDALAFYDALTGLPNRVQLAERLTETIAAAAQDDRSFALHFFDLDGFKAINDRHGHSRGDDVIAMMGKRFERLVAPPNVVARVGGDEFVVIQPNVARDGDARDYAGQLRDAIAEPFVVGGREYRISASVGIAVYPGDGENASTLLASADLALYRVKATGRDAIAFARDLA